MLGLRARVVTLAYANETPALNPNPLLAVSLLQEVPAALGYPPQPFGETTQKGVVGGFSKRVPSVRALLVCLPGLARLRHQAPVLPLRRLTFQR